MAKQQLCLRCVFHHTVQYIWHEDLDSVQANWQEMQSMQLNELLGVFQSHESIPGESWSPRYILDQIRDYEAALSKAII